MDYDARWREWGDMKAYGPMSRITRWIAGRLVRELEWWSVLDYGCGGGDLLEALLRWRPGVGLTGVDVSAEARGLTRRRVPGVCVLPGVEWQSGPAYDLVTCVDVLEHIEDDRRLLRELRGVCRRWLVVATLEGRMRRFEREVGHVRNYGVGELEAKVAGAGFGVVRVVRWGWPFYSPLYREACEVVGMGGATGTYSWRRRLVARSVEAVLRLSSWRRGDYVWVVARPVAVG